VIFYFVKSKFAVPLAVVFVAIVALIFAVAHPVMADSGDGSKSYKTHWAISIGDKSGKLKITEQDTKEKLMEQAIALSEIQGSYPDIKMAKLGKAVNDAGEKFLVWKLISVKTDESDTRIHTVYVLDAKDGELLTQITKEGGSCGDKDKSKSTNTSGEQA
jgi:hypothetical protein